MAVCYMTQTEQSQLHKYYKRLSHNLLGWFQPPHQTIAEKDSNGAINEYNLSEHDQ